MSADVSQKIDLTKPKARNYKKFFLKHNPFPSTGVPEDSPSFTVDREQVIKKFENTIFEIMETDNTILTVMVGENGGGKSHLSKLFRHKINQQLFSRENGMLAAYVKNPGSDFFDLFKTMMDDVGKSHIQKLVTDFIAEKITQDDDFKKFSKLESYGLFKNNKISLSDLLVDSQYLSYEKTLYNKYFSEISNADMVYAILSLVHPDFSIIAWRWLLGDKIDRVDQNKILVHSNMASENAYALLDNFLNTLRVLGLKYFALFLDELEDITTLHRTKLDSYQNNLRQLIDDNRKYLCLYFSITPQQWKKLTGAKVALSRRLSTNWFILDEFDEDETRLLIEQYLYYSRSDDFSTNEAKKRFPDCGPSLCPFTKEAVVAIKKRTKGVISEVLKLGRGLLEGKHDKHGDPKSITEKDVEEFKLLSGSV